MSSVKQVIVMRKDLGMRKGKMIAQGAHASLGVITKLMMQSELTIPPGQHQIVFYPDDDMLEWLTGTFTKICVYVNSEDELLDINAKASSAGLNCCLIRDSGATEFHGVPTYTACAIGPNKSEDIDLITGELKLL